MFCNSCKDRKICKKVCKELNEYLVKDNSYKRWLTVGTSNELEILDAEVNHSNCGGGKKVKAIRYNDNWECDKE